MSLYRKAPDVQPAAGPGGSSAETADAGSRLTENLLSAAGFKPTTVDHQQAAQSFQEALTGHTTATPPPELPPLEVSSGASAHGGSGAMDSTHLSGADLGGQMNGLMQSVMDVAMKLADPLGFINAICQFLIALFMNAGAQFAQALPQIDLYNQAAQAALDTKKLIQP
jgi:hypothetical protein